MRSAVTLFTLLLLLLSGCKTEEEKVKGVLYDFFDRLGEEKIPDARHLATRNSKTMLDMIEMAVRTDPNEAKKYNNSHKEYGPVEIKDSIASVSVIENEITTSYLLKKEDGDWKVLFETEHIIWDKK